MTAIPPLPTPTGAPPWDAADHAKNFWVAFKIGQDWLYIPWSLIRKAKLRPEFHRLRLYVPSDKLVIEILGPRVEELAGELSQHAVTRIASDGPDGLRSIGVLPLEIVEAQDDAAEIAAAVRDRAPETEPAPHEGVQNAGAPNGDDDPDDVDYINLAPL
jgi:hypothetical protein